MLRRPRLLTACLSLALVPPLAGCGSGQPDTSLPPLTPEPGLSLGGPSDGPPRDDRTASRSARAPGFAARVALQRLLRAAAAGNPGACVYVAPDYQKTLFGAAGCRAWMGQAAGHLTAAERAALRGVRVPAATEGANDSEFTVRFTDLRWSGAAPQPRGILRTEYVLRKIGTRWVLAA
ncbi:hypothetical protein ACRYCC_02655 [Actinomadura scrupuli]|uniref:hypothetical protein n=1 Tax=Actinomadura scrupuli TaxID=559629 RepID=UPI003D957D6E